MKNWHVTEFTEADPEGLRKVKALTFHEAMERAAILRAKGFDVRIRCHGQATHEEIESLKRLGKLEIY